MTETTTYRVVTAPTWCDGIVRCEVKIGDLVTLRSDRPDDDGDVRVDTHNGGVPDFDFLALSCLAKVEEPEAPAEPAALAVSPEALTAALELAKFRAAERVTTAAELVADARVIEAALA
jgi:hypothetical protein